MGVDRAVLSLHMRVAFLFCFIVQATFLHARLPDLIPYRKGNLWGYADSTRKMVIEPVYDNVEFFVFGRAVVKKNGKYGVIDRHGSMVLKCIYKTLESGTASGYWTGALLGSKVGVIDSSGAFSIAAVHDRIEWVGGNYAAVIDEQNCTIMNARGDVLFTHQQWSGFLPVYVPDARAFIISDHNKSGVVDEKGVIRIPAAHNWISYLECGYFECLTAKKKTPKAVLAIDSTMRVCTAVYYDKNFKQVRERRLPAACRMRRASVGIEPAYILMPDSRDSLQLLSSFPPWSPEQTEHTPRHKVWGWQRSDSSGWVTMPLYDSTCYFNNGLACFYKGGKAGMVDTSFQEVIPPKYEHLIAVSPQFAMVMRRPSVTFAREPDTRLFLGYVDINGTEYWE